MATIKQIAMAAAAREAKNTAAFLKAANADQAFLAGAVQSAKMSLLMNLAGALDEAEDVPLTTAQAADM